MSNQQSRVMTCRARSLQEALDMVRTELGPETTVLNTREVPTGWWARLAGSRHFEIEARRALPGNSSVAVKLRRRPSPLNQLAEMDTSQAIPRVDVEDHRRRDFRLLWP